MTAVAAPQSWWTGGAAVAVWGAAAANVGIADQYHAMSTQLDNLAWLIALPLLAALEALIGRWLPAALRRAFTTRYLVIASVLWGWIVLLGGASGQRFAPAVGVASVLWLVLCLGAAFWPQAWHSIRLARLPAAVAAGAVLFVAAPAFTASWMATPVQWPAAAGAPTLAPGAASRDVLVLLLDELSDQAVGPVLAALQREGLHVVYRPLQPAGDGTAKVIPAMWLHRRFDDPKPCTSSAICSGSVIFDFARIRVSWPDVDVVGFYHPYCAMNGLRWCRRDSPPGLTDDAPARWSCAVRRRLGTSLPERCQRDQHLTWTTLVERVERSYWQAPFWRKGGVLYAHLPIPHPPGADPRQTLAEQYAASVADAARLTTESVRRLIAAGRTAFTVVVTSDHPLRVASWCANGTYSARRCEESGRLVDTRVPLIVASTGASPDIAGLERNEQVFDLVARLR
ncbi:hypothetical protein J2X16_001138 [Pelomonas aquatica]|uniref:Sulfatase N-terminal domain-containing protein n=1 Tax=Pelomonas aquatica TaxID=431058 RepID=A0ABU1Z5E1_9BURK|nr:hypothetical protein [Pelomonas aquatica]MDR7295817.1 hypothetical protein [Pelomonas aquatica]